MSSGNKRAPHESPASPPGAFVLPLSAHICFLRIRPSLRPSSDFLRFLFFKDNHCVFFESEDSGIRRLAMGKWRRPRGSSYAGVTRRPREAPRLARPGSGSVTVPPGRREQAWGVLPEPSRRRTRRGATCEVPSVTSRSGVTSLTAGETTVSRDQS